MDQSGMQDPPSPPREQTSENPAMEDATEQAAENSELEATEPAAGAQGEHKPEVPTEQPQEEGEPASQREDGETEAEKEEQDVANNGKQTSATQDGTKSEEQAEDFSTKAAAEANAGYDTEAGKTETEASQAETPNDGKDQTAEGQERDGSEVPTEETGEGENTAEVAGKAQRDMEAADQQSDAAKDGKAEDQVVDSSKSKESEGHPGMVAGDDKTVEETKTEESAEGPAGIAAAGAGEEAAQGVIEEGPNETAEGVTETSAGITEGTTVRTTQGTAGEAAEGVEGIPTEERPEGATEGQGAGTPAEQEPEEQTGQEKPETADEAKETSDGADDAQQLTEVREGSETERTTGDTFEPDTAEMSQESEGQTVDTSMAEEIEQKAMAVSQESSAGGEQTTIPRETGSVRSGETAEEGEQGSESQETESDLTRLVERASLEQQHRTLLLQRRQLLARNQRVQQRLSEHFSRRTDEDERVEKNVGELEQRYARYMHGIREQQRFIADEKQRRLEELAAFRAQVDEQMALVASEYDRVVELRRHVALKSRSSRTGRLMSAAEVEAIVSRERGKEVEVHEARLESLRRETRLSRLEQTLHDSEELAGGIHLIDFEQLKIENQTYAEKIEERNEDLTKLRRKISSTVQILTHLKERIQFEHAENVRRERALKTVSAEVTQGREDLALLKQRRDRVRNRTVNQRAAAGLLGHEALLRDFEARVDEEARLVKELQALKRDYAENQRMSNAIRQMERNKKAQSRQRTASTSGGV